MTTKKEKQKITVTQLEEDELPEGAETLARMNPPEKLKIGFQWYDVEVVDEPSHFVKNVDGMYGCVDYQKRKIYINGGTAPDDEANTLLHEVIHALHWFFGYGAVDASNWTHENFCISAANGLCQVFQDNPYLSLYLMVNLGVEGFEAIAIPEDAKRTVQ